MTTEELKKEIKKIINETFVKIDDIYKYNREGEKSLRLSCGRLVFPLYRTKGIRVSEQELRFLFVEQFCAKAQELNLLYSIETPTEHKYNFTGAEPKRDDENGKSGCLDLVLHNAETSKRICIIEFKAHNPDEKQYKKDFLKLKEELSSSGNRYEEDAFGYFVQIVTNTKEKTDPKEGVINTTKKAINDNVSDLYCSKVKHICYSLQNGNGGKIIIGDESDE